MIIASFLRQTQYCILYPSNLRTKYNTFIKKLQLAKKVQSDTKQVFESAFLKMQDKPFTLPNENKKVL